MAGKREMDAALLVSWGLAGKPVSVHMPSGISGMYWRKKAWPSRVQGLSAGRVKAET